MECICIIYYFIECFRRTRCGYPEFSDIRRLSDPDLRENTMNDRLFESTIHSFVLAGIFILAMVACKQPLDKNEVNKELLSKFDFYPLVALGENHGWIEESEFILSLIKDSLFSQKVNDVVIECGNARFQSLVDDYVNGEPVPDSALVQTWRNMTVLCSCDAPVYAEIFRTVREVNHKLTPTHWANRRWIGLK